MLVPIETIFELSVTYQSQLVYAQQQVIKVLLQDHNDNVVQLRVNKEGVNGDEVQEQQIAIEMLNDFNVDPERLVPGDMAWPWLSHQRGYISLRLRLQPSTAEVPRVGLASLWICPVMWLENSTKALCDCLRMK